MRPLRALAPVTLIMALVMSTPALAACFGGCGGGYDAFSFEKEYLYPGQNVTWDLSIYIDKRAAGPAAGPFYAHLVPPVRRMGARPKIDGGVALATVGATPARRQNVVDLSLSFVVPAGTEPGAYAIEVCDDPCTQRLGYLYPTTVEVVASDVEARLTERIDDLMGKIRRLRGSIDRAIKKETRRNLEPVQERLVTTDRALNVRISELEDLIEELEARQAGFEKRVERSEGATPQGALLLGAGVLALGLVLAHRRRPSGAGA